MNKSLSKKDIYLYGILAFFIVLNAYWMLSLRILPFIDLPFHLSSSTIYRFFDNPEFHFKEYYEIPTVLKSNNFHLLFTSLKIFPDVEIANKVFYLLYVILFPLSILFLIKEINGNKWFVLLSFLFIYNHNTHWGFTGFTISVPVIFFFIAYLIRYLNKQSYYMLISMFLLLLLIFSMHFQNAIFVSFIYLVSVIVTFRKNLFKAIISLSILLPLFVMMLIVYLGDAKGNYESLFPFLVRYAKEEFISGIPVKLQMFLVADNFYFTKNLVLGSIYAVIFSLTIIIPSVLFFLKRKSYHKVITIPIPVVILLISAFAFYFILPADIPGQNVVNQRFTVFIFLGLLTVASLLKLNLKQEKIFIAVTVLIVFFQFTVVSKYYYDFEMESKVFNEKIFPDSPDKVIYGYFLNYKFYTRPVYLHFHNYYTVWKKGITGGIVDYRYGIIRRKAGYKELPIYHEWIADKKDLNETEYRNIDFILSKADTVPTFKGFKLQSKTGSWYMLENINSDRK